jgi:hypothetical protein
VVSPFSPKPLTWTSVHPSRTVGRGTLRRVRTSGGPGRSTTTARIMVVMTPLPAGVGERAAGGRAARLPAEQHQGGDQAGHGPAGEHNQVVAGEDREAGGVLQGAGGGVDHGLGGQVASQGGQPVRLADRGAEDAGEKDHRQVGQGQDR